MRSVRSSLNENGLQAIRETIRAHAGMVFCEGREKELEAGIRRAMQHAGIADLDRFVGMVDTNQQLFDTLIADLTVGETYFFREPSQFETLRKIVLPDLLRRRPPDTTLRAWSAGCASGEEPYSLAMLLEEEGLAERWTILGTDISRPILKRAREAHYGPWSFRGERADLAGRYFDRHGNNLVLRDRIRSRVAFQYLNLASRHSSANSPGRPDFDLIFCRNVMIYFDAPTVADVAQRLFHSLRDGGWLISGASDPPLWDHAAFDVVTTETGVFYRKGRKADFAAILSHAPRAAVPASAAELAHGALHIDVGQPENAGPVPVNRPEAVLTGDPPRADPDTDAAYQSLVSEIRGLADRGDAHGAESSIIAALEDYPVSAELHYLHAIVLMQLGRTEQAVASLRRVIYIDPSLAMAHFTLGAALRALGAAAEARRTYQNTLELCKERPMDELLPLSADAPIRTIVVASRAHLRLLPPETM